MREPKIKEIAQKLFITNNWSPEQISNRLVLGYIEADTILGKPGESCIVTLVDRNSCYLLARKGCEKASGPVANKMIDVNGLPKDWLKAITPDRGNPDTKINPDTIQKHLNKSFK